MDYRQFQLVEGNPQMNGYHQHQGHIMDPSWQLKIPKQEPIDERDDSGINSGNSSPNSENSRDLMNPYSTPPPSVPMAQRPANGGFSPQHYPIIKNMYNSAAPNNLLSPPMSETSTNEGKDHEDALQNLQMALKQNSYLAIAANITTKSCSEDSKSDDDSSSQNKTPKSSGKRKTIKCKHCSLTFVNKEDMWEHYRTHIKQEKLLECPRCAFVTEYKHHFEYHLRNHDGSKPFKCQECSYECVSKSMLNSHMKSHSTVYQYQCANCTYVSKYCHSLKQHLRKYNHKPGTVLSPEGIPNPFSVIDVYGTRRGPKLKKPNVQQVPDPPIVNPFMINQQQQFPQFPILPQLQEMSQFFNPLLLSNPTLLQNLQRIARERQLSNSTEEPNSPIASPKPEDTENNNEPTTTTIKDEPEEQVLDLSQSSPYKKRRKGPAYKLTNERMDTTDDEDEHLTTMFSNVEVVQQQEEPRKTPTKCQYCNIDFHDDILHNMHMGYHGFKDPFTCNLCGESYSDKVRFFLHIGQKKH